MYKNKQHIHYWASGADLVVFSGGIIRRTVRRSYAHAPILRASTNFGQGFSPRPATILLLFKEVDRQNARTSKVLTTGRLVFF